MESKQGIQEFLTEINIISNIRHPNLVQLIGCCVEGNHRILVYEYLENNSLARALLGNDWIIGVLLEIHFRLGKIWKYLCLCVVKMCDDLSAY